MFVLLCFSYIIITFCWFIWLAYPYLFLLFRREIAWLPWFQLSDSVGYKKIGNCLIKAKKKKKRKKETTKSLCNYNQNIDVTWAFWRIKSPAMSTVCSKASSDWQQSYSQISSSLVLCKGNPPITAGFSSRRVGNAEGVSMSWRHHV